MARLFLFRAFGLSALVHRERVFRDEIHWARGSFDIQQNDLDHKRLVTRVCLQASSRRNSGSQYGDGPAEDQLPRHRDHGPKQASHGVLVQAVDPPFHSTFQDSVIVDDWQLNAGGVRVDALQAFQHFPALEDERSLI